MGYPAAVRFNRVSTGVGRPGPWRVGAAVPKPAQAAGGLRVPEGGWL